MHTSPNVTLNKHSLAHAVLQVFVSVGGIRRARVLSVRLEGALISLRRTSGRCQFCRRNPGLHMAQIGLAHTPAVGRQPMLKGLAAVLKSSDSQSGDRWQPWLAQWPMLLSPLAIHLLSSCVFFREGLCFSTFLFLLCPPLLHQSVISLSLHLPLAQPLPLSPLWLAVWFLWSNEPWRSRGSLPRVD